MVTSTREKILEEKKRVNVTGDGKTIVGDKSFLQHLADSTESERDFIKIGSVVKLTWC